MSKEKLKQILVFFKDEGVTIPMDVRNSIEDVFNENENINGAHIYFKEDAIQFENDLVLVNEVKAQLKGNSTGKSNNVFTYYGEIDYSLSEFVKLYDGELLLEDITHIDRQMERSRVNPTSWAVVLIEKVQWESGEITRESQLFIYCPHESEDVNG